MPGLQTDTERQGGAGTSGAARPVPPRQLVRRARDVRGQEANRVAQQTQPPQNTPSLSDPSSLTSELVLDKGIHRTWTPQPPHPPPLRRSRPGLL